MLDTLKLWNFGSGTLPRVQDLGRYFVLQTCQRSLILSSGHLPFSDETLPAHEHLEGEAAYTYLLETICGLKSKLIGENEIVGQFKDAYKIFAASTIKDTRLLVILEKLFKDAKDIRTQYLIGISQKTYASLTRKHLVGRMKAPHIVILGSGALAEDLINQFKKKALVSICARNTERVNELAKTHGLGIIPWDNHQDLHTHPFIANTIGFEGVLLDSSFFEKWSQNHTEKLFVDLGGPSSIRTELSFEQGLVRLEDIFNEGAIVESQKQQQIELARKAMLERASRRRELLGQKKLGLKLTSTPHSVSDMRYL